MTDVEILVRINTRLATLRRLLAHDHRDEPFWSKLGFCAAHAQRQRHLLRADANLLHVARATQRGRVHSARFATLEAQRAWLGGMDAIKARVCELAARDDGAS